MMRSVFHTARKRYVHPENLTRFFESGQVVIMAAWHNRNFLSPFGYLAHHPKGRRLHPMASASKDGALAAHAMAGIGLNCVRGSTRKGGSSALRKMIRILRDGQDLAFTPDGPRGPLHHIEEGVIVAAKMTGAPIVPISFQAKRKKRLNSWDRLIVPALFTRINYVYGEPLFVPRDCGSERIAEYASRLQQELLRIGKLAGSFDENDPEIRKQEEHRNLA